MFKFAGTLKNCDNLLSIELIRCWMVLRLLWFHTLAPNLLLNNMGHVQAFAGHQTPDTEVSIIFS